MMQLSNSSQPMCITSPLLSTTSPKTESKADNYLGHSLQQICRGAKLLTGFIGSTIFWSTLIRGGLALENPPHSFARRTGSSPVILSNISDQLAYTGKDFSLSILPTDYFADSDSEFTLNLYENKNETLPSWLNFKFDSCNPEGLYDTPGSANDVKVVGRIAYVADGTSGLQILDVSNSTHPILLGTYSPPQGGIPIPPQPSAAGVDVIGNIAYVADMNYGLQVIDVSNPAAPTLLGRYNGQTIPTKVHVANNLAYVVGSNVGLEIIDISNPAAPNLVGSCGFLVGSCQFNNSPDSMADIDVDGNIAYVADSNSGLRIVDVSNPAVPNLLGTYNTPDHALRVDVKDNVAYVGNYLSGLQIINVSNPSAPTLLAACATPKPAVAVRVIRDIAFVTGGNTVQIIDVSNPSAPALLKTYDTPGVALSVDTVGHFSYIAANVGGIQIFQERLKLSGTPENSDIGNYDLELTAEDPQMNQARIAFILRVVSSPETMSPSPSSIPKASGKKSKPLKKLLPILSLLPIGAAARIAFRYYRKSGGVKSREDNNNAKDVTMNNIYV